MNFTKRLFFFLIISMVGLTKAQFTMHPMLKVGYDYQNSNFGEVGATFLFLEKDNVLYRMGGSALVGSSHGKIAVLPKLQGDILLNFQKGKSLRHSYYFLLGAEATTKYITPKAGISIFGLMDFKGGYGFQIPNQTLNGKVMKGFNFNFTLNIPLVVFKK